MIFIKKHWFSIIVVSILCYILIDSQNKTAELVKQINELETTNSSLEEQSVFYLTQIDSLSNVNSEIVEIIKYIKVKENEKINAIDTLSISDLQKFFSDRY